MWLWVELVLKVLQISFQVTFLHHNMWCSSFSGSSRTRKFSNGNVQCIMTSWRVLLRASLRSADRVLRSPDGAFRSIEGRLHTKFGEKIPNPHRVRGDSIFYIETSVSEYDVFRRVLMLKVSPIDSKLFSTFFDRFSARSETSKCSYKKKIIRWVKK